MSRRPRPQYRPATAGYWASRCRARSPRSGRPYEDSLSFGAAVRLRLPSHTASRQRNRRPRGRPSPRAVAYSSWLPPAGPIEDSHLLSVRPCQAHPVALRAPSVSPAPSIISPLAFFSTTFIHLCLPALYIKLCHPDCLTLVGREGRPREHHSARRFLPIP